jgi:hypothetical protein
MFASSFFPFASFGFVPELRPRNGVIGWRRGEKQSLYHINVKLAPSKLESGITRE